MDINHESSTDHANLIITIYIIPIILVSNKPKHPTEHNTISVFKMYNNVFNKPKCNMKLQYFKSMLDENKHDMKKNLVHIKTIYWKTK